MKALGLLAVLLLGGLGWLLFSESGGGRAADAERGLSTARMPRAGAAPEPASTDEPAPSVAQPRATPALTSSPDERSVLPSEGASASRTPAASGGIEAGRGGRRALLGVVIDDTGPLTNAQVLLSVSGETTQSVSANDRGAFRIELPVPAQDVVLTVRARGYATLVRPFGSQTLPGEQRLGNLRLARGTALDGVVVDSDGTPLGGVEVELKVARDQPFGENARTGPDGRFQFLAAPSGRVFLTARTEELGARTIEHYHQRDAIARIELVPSSTLRLLIRGSDGQAVARASVRAQPLDSRDAHRQGTSDSEGRCVFEGLDGQRWRISATAQGYQPGHLEQALADGREVELELQAWPCASGRVLTPDGEAPPSGTIVQAVPAQAPPEFAGRPGADVAVEPDGSFRVCQLRPGDYQLRFSAPGYALTASRGFRVQPETDVELGRVTLVAGSRLVVRCSDGDEPAQGVQVELLRRKPAPGQRWLEAGSAAVLARTNAKGEALFEAQAAGVVWVICRGESWVSQPAGPYTIRAGASLEPRPVELVRGRAHPGRVFDSTGTGVPRMRVMIAGAGIDRPPLILTDPDGNFTTPVLAKGWYTVSAEGIRDGERQRSEETRVEIDPESTGHSAEIELRMP